MPHGTATRVVSKIWSKVPPNLFQRSPVIHTAAMMPSSIVNA